MKPWNRVLWNSVFCRSNKNATPLPLDFLNYSLSISHYFSTLLWVTSLSLSKLYRCISFIYCLKQTFFLVDTRYLSIEVLIKSLSLSLSLRACVSCGHGSLLSISAYIYVCMYAPMLIHAFPFSSSVWSLLLLCDSDFMVWEKETTTQQCLRKYFGNFCWDILVDTSKISPLISLKSTFGKVFFLFLHFTFTSISISILYCIWFFVWTKQYYILGHFFGIFGTYWHLH